MSSRYTADGKRKSAQTHARRSHECSLCGRKVFGNGGVVSHGRGHVRRGEALELVKHYPTSPPLISRLFMARDDEHVAEMLERGFEIVAS